LTRMLWWPSRSPQKGLSRLFGGDSRSRSSCAESSSMSFRRAVFQISGGQIPVAARERFPLNTSSVPSSPNERIMAPSLSTDWTLPERYTLTGHPCKRGHLELWGACGGSLLVPSRAIAHPAVNARILHAMGGERLHASTEAPNAAASP